MHEATATQRGISSMDATKGAGALDGKRYLESLRDGREVWYRGKRVDDVTRFPEFAEMAKSIARIYDMQCAPETRDAMTYEQDNGLRASYSYFLPTEPEHLLLRRRNTEVWVREVFGMCGRLPDFCASMVIGYYDIRHELAKLSPDLAKNTERLKGRQTAPVKMSLSKLNFRKDTSSGSASSNKRRSGKKK